MKKFLLTLAVLAGVGLSSGVVLLGGGSVPIIIP
ncbi:hypothetical protein JOC54_002437 [Alkalihalobacillus xiaoxiensis]|uniref:Uncharacterized protein n=1 Tax=Shouchella xiaoxiensis TaxID=766895 RepID=A0ABS2SUI2_9BACI|nr:hypothetical protein [Shouchella xiaoxiensis]